MSSSNTIVTKVLKEGTSDDKPPKGSVVTVHYTGWLIDPATNERGAKFDSSVDRNQKFQFTLGAGEVIVGWDAAVKDMTRGSKIQVTIPPSLAYGSRGVGPIKPNSTLLFEIELFDWGQPEGLFSIKNIVFALICIAVVVFVKGNPFK